MKADDARLKPISSGTVLDHLPAGTALKILKILNLEKPENAVTVAINTESKSGKEGKKDLVLKNYRASDAMALASYYSIPILVRKNLLKETMEA